MNYFKIETIEKGMEAKRGEYMIVEFDNSKGETRKYSGFLCKGKGNFMLNIGESVKEPDFKSLPHDRIKSVHYNGLTIRPKGGN